MNFSKIKIVCSKTRSTFTRYILPSRMLSHLSCIPPLPLQSHKHTLIKTTPAQYMHLGLAHNGLSASFWNKNMKVPLCSFGKLLESKVLFCLDYPFLLPKTLVSTNVSFSPYFEPIISHTSQYSSYLGPWRSFLVSLFCTRLVILPSMHPLLPLFLSFRHLLSRCAGWYAH